MTTTFEHYPTNYIFSAYPKTLSKPLENLASMLIATNSCCPESTSNRIDETPEHGEK